MSKSDKSNTIQQGDLVYVYDPRIIEQPIVDLHGIIVSHSEEEPNMWNVLIYETVIQLNQDFLYKNPQQLKEAKCSN